MKGVQFFSPLAPEDGRVTSSRGQRGITMVEANWRRWVTCGVVLCWAAACSDTGPDYFNCPNPPQGPDIPMVNLVCRRFGIYGSAGCLSDKQICQFMKGVSTQADVRQALGMPQGQRADPDSPGTQLYYFCEQGTSEAPVRNDRVLFYFDASDVLIAIDVMRGGSAETPPPSCLDAFNAPKTTCGSWVAPPLPTVTCRYGDDPDVQICTDASGDKWSSRCSGGLCDCRHTPQGANEDILCSCEYGAGKRLCCPGVRDPTFGP